jgi:hypothetical protein
MAIKNHSKMMLQDNQHKGLKISVIFKISKQRFKVAQKCRRMLKRGTKPFDYIILRKSFRSPILGILKLMDKSIHLINGVDKF